jgi:hypothetical protein
MKGKTKDNRTNFASIFFAIISGTILTANLFEYLPWEVWKIGIIFFGIVTYLNFVYKMLKAKTKLYHFSQMIISILGLLLLAHAILSIILPDYLAVKNQDIPDQELFNQTMELRKTRYADIKEQKFNTIIEDGNYTITDSKSNDYFFKIHPKKSAGSNAAISHKERNGILEIELKSVSYNLDTLEDLFKLHPQFIFGLPYTPVNINLNIVKEGSLNLNLKEKNVKEFLGLFEGGFGTLKFSKDSIPSKKFHLTVRNSEVELNLPKELRHNVRYIVRNDAQLYLEGNNISGNGNYQILSEGDENPCDVEVVLDSGKLTIKTN